MSEVKKDGIEGFLGAFAERARPGEPGWLGGLRESAMEQFASSGIPRTQEEEWKYTSLRNLEKASYQLAGSEGTDKAPDDVNGMAAIMEGLHGLVFVNGVYQEDLSSPPDPETGVTVLDMAQAIESRPEELQGLLGSNAASGFQVFSSLNSALFSHGAYVHVAADARLEKPLHLLFLATGAQSPFMVHPRNLFNIQEGGELVVLEDYSGQCEGDYFCNPVTEVFSSKSSSVRLYKVIREGPAATHVSNLGVYQEEESSFTANTYCLGGKLVRNDVVASLDGERIECTLNGLAVGNGDQHIDNHTRIIHSKPNCNSWEVYKSVLADNSHGVFNGKIFVAQDAQKTDAKQTNQSLLLSDSAVMDSKPELEIYADDVKCSHGSASGNMDENSLHYLMTRGLSKEVAAKLLVKGFLSDIVEFIKNPTIKQFIENKLEEQINGY